MRARLAITSSIEPILSGLPGASRKPCSRRQKAIITASCMSLRLAMAAALASAFGSSSACRVHGGGDGLAGGETIEACFAADRERGKAGAALAQSPFQQRVVAAADDRRRLRPRQPGRPRHAGGQPVIEFGLGEQPAAGDLGARHRALGHHLIDLAFLEAEIGGGFGGGEKLHAAHLHSCASFPRLPESMG